MKILSPQNMGYNFITPKNEGNVSSHGIYNIISPNTPFLKPAPPSNFCKISIRPNYKLKWHFTSNQRKLQHPAMELKSIL